MSDLKTKNPAHHEPAILQGARRVRYLKLIALFKIGKGVLLGAGYFMALFTPKHQALHDVAAATVVLKR